MQFWFMETEPRSIKSVSEMRVVDRLAIERRLTHEAVAFVVRHRATGVGPVCWPASAETQEARNHVDPVEAAWWLVRSPLVARQRWTPVIRRSDHISEIQRDNGAGAPYKPAHRLARTQRPIDREDSPERNKRNNGSRQQPADTFSPRWVLIAIVRQVNAFDDWEQQHKLHSTASDFTEPSTLRLHDTFA